MNKAAKKIRLVAFDVDGTLTDGSIYMGEAGEVLKVFNAKDGLALAQAHRVGLKTGFITGRSSRLVQNRAEELHCDFCLMAVADKGVAMEKLLAADGLTWAEAAYMGDDLNDLPLIKRAGLSASPRDGAAEVKAAASLVTHAKGGRGAAREFIEKILKAQGLWAGVVQSFEGSQKKD